MGEQSKRKLSTYDPKDIKKSKTEDLSNSAQKRQLKKERQSHRRHAETVTEAKVLWNKLREKTNTAKDTEVLMDQVMLLIRGKVNEIALQHDASRVIQAAIQFGNKEQRKELLREICADGAAGLIELSKIRYAHFICLKFIKYCQRDQESVQKIVKSFKGSIPKLAIHAVAARVVESLFLEFPTKATVSLKQELYGPHFSLFVQDLKSTPTLRSNLADATTETQKTAAIKFVKDIISKGITKSFFGYTYFQKLFAEYMEEADANDIRAMASSVADHSIHLLSTRAGARVVAFAASYGTPKDRKRICKSLKGYSASSLLHRDAYLALLKLIQVTDDTVSINKSIFNEILTAAEEKDEKEPKLLELVLSETASKLFLMLFVDDDESRLKYFDPYERLILEENATVKDNGKEVSTSKKDPAVRRKELRGYLHDPLLDLCLEHPIELITSLPGSRVLKEVYSHTGQQDIAKAIIAVCEQTFKNDITIFEDPIGHRTLKNMILCDIERKEPIFSKLFLNSFGGKFSDVLKSNRGAFVVAALLKIPSLQQQVSTKLKPLKKQIKVLSNAEGPTAGYEAILKAIRS